MQILKTYTQTLKSLTFAPCLQSPDCLLSPVQKKKILSLSFKTKLNTDKFNIIFVELNRSNSLAKPYQVSVPNSWIKLRFQVS